jgi:hypothetical protein
VLVVGNNPDAALDLSVYDADITHGFFLINNTTMNPGVTILLPHASVVGRVIALIETDPTTNGGDLEAYPQVGDTLYCTTATVTSASPAPGCSGYFYLRVISDGNHVWRVVDKS